MEVGERKREDGAGTGGQRGSPGARVCLSEEQQQRRRVIRWERFLPRRSLRVLLVEQDDSTRHIVTALLRKCSYHVAAVADGLKAWDVLKDKNYNFDLVLSEVEVPSLSGISLLCKIMANEPSKNIPVIMMSSHDSVSVVFRCMQKGAVDFLVKPVRKNELRNLWQHVWRRHCSTSFVNATENVPNNEAVSENMSDNNAASNNVSANAGKGSTTGESCDGGENQSFVSRPPAQSEISKQQGVPPPDDNTAIVKSLPQKFDDDKATSVNPIENHDDDKAKDKSREIEVFPPAQETAVCVTVHEQTHSYDNSTPKDSMPSWEHYLRRQQPNDCDRDGFQEKNILNHSAASAFSRYANTSNCLQHKKSGSSATTIHIGSGDTVDISQIQYKRQENQNERSLSSVPEARRESSHDNEDNPKSYCQKPSSNDDDAEPLASVPSGEDNCTGYSAIKNHATFPHSHIGVMSLPIPMRVVPFHSFCSGYGPILNPMFYHEPAIATHDSAVAEQAKHVATSEQQTDDGNHVNAGAQSTAFHSSEDDCHPLLEQRKGDTVDAERSDPKRSKLRAHVSEENSEQSGSYNWDIANGGGVTDTAADTRTGLECSNENELQNYRGKDVDPHRSHREAALIKFRLKRKERCFEKKVRYHSRKMLAEQRPRVKGQFVRQVAIQPNTTATVLDD